VWDNKKENGGQVEVWICGIAFFHHGLLIAAAGYGLFRLLIPDFWVQPAIASYCFPLIRVFCS
jgi:hypothetical protein